MLWMDVTRMSMGTQKMNLSMLDVCAPLSVGKRIPNEDPDMQLSPLLESLLLFFFHLLLFCDIKCTKTLYNFHSQL